MSQPKSLRAKGLLPRCLLFLSLGSLGTYLSFHLYYLLSGTDASDALFYVQSYLSRAWLFVYPCLTVTVMLILYAYVGTKSAVGAAFLLSLSGFVYAFPYYYVVLIEESFGESALPMTLIVSLLADGVNTPIALLLSLGFSIVEALLSALRALIIFGVALIVGRVIAKRRGISDGWAAMQPALESTSAFDLSEDGARLTLSVVLVQFVSYLISEILSTVSFFGSVGTAFSAGELVSVIGSYVFLVVALVFAQYISTAARNGILKVRLDNDN